MEAPPHLTLPGNQAALASFPPGCPVLVSGDCEASAAASSPQAYLGQVHSVYIDLGSTTRDNFYRIRPSSSAASAADTELRSAPESDLKYAPGCTVTANASALPPFVTEGGGGDTRDATIISCVGGGVPGSNNYYLLEVLPGPGDSWTNIQSTVPVDSVQYRDPTKESLKNSMASGPAPAPVAQEPPAAAGVANDDNNNDDQGARVISPHPHTIPTDGDGSSLDLSSRAPPVPSITINTDRKRSAEQLDCDGGSSTLSPMPTDGSISVASSNAIVEEVVRRIDIPDTVDANKIKGALVGPDCKINERMQAKFRVTITILGLDDAISSSAVESFSKLGPISYKVGDKCIMIRGPERRVHDAAKVVIHMLVNKCYDGNDKNALTRELRVVRQVRKKAQLSPRSESAMADLPSPTKKLKTEPEAAGFFAAPGSELTEYPSQRASGEETQHSGSVSDPLEPHLAQGSQLAARFRPPKATPYGQGQWRAVLWAPSDVYPAADFVGPVLGHRGSIHRELEAKYNVRISLRGESNSAKVGNARDSLHAIILGNSSQAVNDAAIQVAERWNGETTNMRSVSCPNLSPACQQLMGKSSFDGQQWNIDVKSPLDPDWSVARTALCNTETFKCIIGEGGSKKKNFVAMFKGGCFLCLRGGGIHDQNGKPTHGPLRVYIKGPDLVVVENAAAHISRVLVDGMAGNGSLSQTESYYGPAGANPNQRQAHSAMAQQPTSETRALLSGNPLYDDQSSTWFLDVFSPLDQCLTFGVLIGEGGKEKQKLIQKFDRKVFFCLRGDGLQSKSAAGDSSGPLRVFVQGPAPDVVIFAAEHIASILLEQKRAEDSSIPRNSSYRADSTSRFGHYGEPNGEYRRDRQQIRLPPNGSLTASMKLLGEPFHSGMRWAMMVHSPLDEQPLFNVIVGGGGVNKKKLTRAFPNVFFTIAGRGVRSNGSVRMTHRKSDDPLHVLVEAADKEVLLVASKHVAVIVSDAAAAQSPHRYY